MFPLKTPPAIGALTSAAAHADAVDLDDPEAVPLHAGGKSLRAGAATAVAGADGAGTCRPMELRDDRAASTTRNGHVPPGGGMRYARADGEGIVYSARPEPSANAPDGGGFGSGGSRPLSWPPGQADRSRSPAGRNGRSAIPRT